MIYGMAVLVCFPSLVQRMSLAAKCSRARANMINREQRLQAMGGGVGKPSAPHSLASLCGKQAMADGETRHLWSQRGKRRMRKGDLFLHQQGEKRRRRRTWMRMVL